MFEKGTKYITGVTTRAELWDAIVDLDMGFVKNLEDGKVYWKNSPFYFANGSNGNFFIISAYIEGSDRSICPITTSSFSSSGWDASRNICLDYYIFGDNNIIFGIRLATEAMSLKAAFIKDKTENEWCSTYYADGNPVQMGVCYTKGVVPTKLDNSQNYKVTTYPYNSVMLSKYFNGTNYMDEFYVCSSHGTFSGCSVSKIISNNKTFLLFNPTSVSGAYMAAFDITEEI